MATLPLPASTVPFGSTSDGTPTTVFYSWLKALFDNLTALLALFPGGTSSAVWTAYVPVATAATGTITAYTSTGRYYQIGKIVFVQIQVHITTAGSASGELHVTLPVPRNTSFAYSMAGFEDDTPSALTVMLQAGNAFLSALAGVGGTSAIGSNVTYIFSGFYEAA